MFNQSLNNLNGVLALSATLLVSACNGGGGDGGTTSLPSSRSAQNVVYLDDNTNQSLLAAFDDGSASPFSLLDVNGGTIERNSIVLSPDGRHVAFTVFAEGASTADLYVSHVNGAYLTRVTALLSNREVTEVVWSPDSSRLVYLADTWSDNQYELYMTTAAFDSADDISAGNELISGTLSIVHLDIASPSWSPDGSKVAYTVTDDRRSTPNRVVGLNYHDTRIGDRHSVRLSSPRDFPPHQDIPDYTWSADGLHLAYRSDDTANDLYRVYRIDFTQSTLSPIPGIIISAAYAESYAFSQDSRYLATVFHNFPGPAVYRLAVSESGSGADVIKAESLLYPLRMNWANTSSILAYSKTDSTGTGNLYLMDVASDTEIQVSSLMGVNEMVEEFDWSPNDDYLGYTSTRGLHLVSATDPVPQLIHDSAFGELANYKLEWPWSHNGDRLAYSIGDSAGDTTSLHVYRLAAPGQAIEVAGPFQTGVVVSRPVWSNDDARLAFRTYQAGCVSDLYTTSSASHNVMLIPGDECQSNFAY